MATARVARWVLVGVTALSAAGCPPDPPHDYYEAPPVLSPAEASSGAQRADGRREPDDAEARTSTTDAEPADAAQPDAEPFGTKDGSAPVDGAATTAGSGASGASSGVPAPARACAPCMLPSFRDLFARLAPSVVNIYTQEVVHRRLPQPWRAVPEREGRGTSLGSGLVLDEDGYIVTNAHVVENAAEIRVRFDDDEELPARLVGIDPVRDLALLKVDGKAGLRAVQQGDSDALAVGDWVIAIGNPLGLSHTLTKGIISAMGRAEFLSDRAGYLDLLQTDAAINEGNSGGPLFNLRGEVVGIATAVSAQGQGIGFAIPWNAVRAALPRLRQGGQVSRSWLGVFVRPATDGVLVVGVVDDSPAARAHVQPGDLIKSLDGRTPKSVSEFRLQVASGVAGRDVSLVIRRGDRDRHVTVRLEEARGVR